ncbi:hypothetical protein DFH94DRAFT_101842 [Russula ochroleuca]|jgi:hypothetical protein|uniref:RING-type domain-containing protein n=1 Tax=Russula ochroleuca TaxID=152965 RepID=A0A9P5MSC9_9AGAM|nr:hypothetical protein DFH94DRAFT_101842 [Russula ochroleuca]
MDQTPVSSPSSPLVATPPQVFTSTLSTPLNPKLVPLQASPLSSPSQPTRRLPRSRSRPQLSSRASLESIIEESSGENHEHPPTHATSNPTPEFTGEKEHTRVMVSRLPGWNGKKGITSGRGMRDVCGICFESAVKPNKSRCCGQLFCFQHLSDWLSATSSDGRCPTCRVPLSIETDTISLHSPAKPKLSAVSFLPTPLPPRRRSPSSLRSRRFMLSPRNSSSSSSSSSSQEQDSDVGSSTTSSSTSDGEDGAPPNLSSVSSFQPKYDSVSDMMSDLAPLREFGSVLTLVGCALVIGTLLS